MKNSWERHVKRVRLTAVNSNGPEKSAHDQVVSSKYSSYLPSVYTGLANRVDRYRQYDQMDQDPEISNGLDIIADFCTQNLDELMSSFEIRYKDHMGSTEIQIIDDRRIHWSKINDFTTRIFDMFRNTLKYGDQFFIRDPETYEWHWVDPYNVEKIILNESLGKEPIIYYIKGVALNLKDKVASNNLVNAAITAYPGSMPNSLGNGQQYGGGSGGATGDMFRGGNTETTAVDADHVIHISLSSGMDQYAPFGVSILENVFKTYKQKELLEDSIIIYRVQRAPERRVFKIDTGELPPNIAMQHVERVKNSIHQRRIPNAKGGSTSLMDAAYNPMSILEDYFFPQSADGRGSSVETLPGGENLGQIDDLKWFNNKLIRGLKIPSSYLPFGPDDSNALFNDGKMGQALIQELRFNNYCQRLQNTIVKQFDHEFKKFILNSGNNIDCSSFNLVFRPPTNFASYRKAELESSLINAYSSLHEIPFIAKQTVLKKMGWTEEEIAENERLYLQENPGKKKQSTATASLGADMAGGIGDAGLQSVGVPNPEDPDTIADDLGMDSGNTGTDQVDTGESFT